MGCTEHGVCPVRETLQYVEVWDPAPGPFFWFKDHAPLTKSVFVKRVWEALLTLGLNAHDYAGHSFRIGVATAAAQAGLEDSVFQSLGRWSSAVSPSYIQTPREQLAHYSRPGGTSPQDTD